MPRSFGGRLGFEDLCEAEVDVCRGCLLSRDPVGKQINANDEPSLESYAWADAFIADVVGAEVLVAA